MSIESVGVWGISNHTPNSQKRRKEGRGVEERVCVWGIISSLVVVSWRRLSVRGSWVQEGEEECSERIIAVSPQPPPLLLFEASPKGLQGKVERGKKEKEK